MALIHERLYQSDHARPRRSDRVRPRAHRNAAPLLRSRQAHPLDRRGTDGGDQHRDRGACGLILNELVTNALKHGFEPGIEGVLKIVVGRSAEGLLSVEVRDSGRGLPPDSPIESAASMGLQLIVALTRQLKGTLDVENDGGAVFKLAFRELEYAAR